MPEREKVARGRNYTAAEDLELARAWIQVSTDAGVGINQTAEDFWTRVKEAMETSKTIAPALASDKLDPRRWSGLKAHFGQVMMAVAKYIGCAKRAEAMRQSGTTERDTMKTALALFKERTGGHFAYIDCYDLLSKCPKFEQELHKGRGEARGENKRKSSQQEASPPDQPVTTTTQASQSGAVAERPYQGIKAAKRVKLDESMQLRTVKAQEALSESMSIKARVLKEQLLLNQANQRLHEEQALHAMLNELFCINPNGSAHAAYIEKRRAVLLRRLDVLSESLVSTPPTPTETTTPPLPRTTTEPRMAYTPSHQDRGSAAGRSPLGSGFDSPVGYESVELPFTFSANCLSPQSQVVITPTITDTQTSLIDVSDSLTASFPLLAQSSQLPVSTAEEDQ
ncbi:hypothetical protein PF003_g25076 [Phytophthora fragariae]|nr:hypothetical protein PF003_g25076 [Phytophthora fragariae]